MVKKQGKSSTNIKEKSDGFIHIFISRLTIKPTLSLYHIWYIKWGIDMKKYSIYDSYGYLIRGNFNSYKAAYTFKIVMNRLDWTIKWKDSRLYLKECYYG